MKRRALLVRLFDLTGFILAGMFVLGVSFGTLH